MKKAFIIAGNLVVAATVLISILAFSKGNVSEQEAGPVQEIIDSTAIPVETTVIDDSTDIVKEDVWELIDDSIPGFPDAQSYISLANEDHGFIKYYSTWKDHPFYYNSRHGFYVVLPKELGPLQSGENILGAHDNLFYNSDNTLAVSAGAMFYDVLLYDFPNYPDSLKAREQEYLNELGETKTRKLKNDVWISQGKIDRSNSENPPIDRFIRKWLLKKDVSGRECQMYLTIYYCDSLSDRLPEFQKIIDRFPDRPVKF